MTEKLHVFGTECMGYHDTESLSNSVGETENQKHQAARRTNVYVRRLSGGDERLAEDITSEAFFRALRRVDSFRGDCDIRVWLCQIAKNCYYTHLKQSRRTEHTADMEQLISEAEESPEEMLLRSENAQQVKHLLHELPDPYKEVFMWRTLGELSFKEIGKLFHKTENWACVTYHRARKMIQKGMEVDEDEK